MNNPKENCDHNSLPSIEKEKGPSLSGGEYREILGTLRGDKLINKADQTSEGIFLNALLETERDPEDSVSYEEKNFSLEALFGGKVEFDNNVLGKTMGIFFTELQRLEEEKGKVESQKNLIGKDQELAKLNQKINKINGLCQRMTAHKTGKDIPEVLDDHKELLKQGPEGQQRVENLEANERELERQRKDRRMVKGLLTKLFPLGVLTARLADFRGFEEDTENEGIQGDIKNTENEIEKKRNEVVSYLKQEKIENIFSSDEREKIIQLIEEFTKEGFAPEKIDEGVEGKSWEDAIKTGEINVNDFIISTQEFERKPWRACLEKMIKINQEINLTKQDINQEEDKMWQEIYQKVWGLGEVTPGTVEIEIGTEAREVITPEVDIRPEGEDLERDKDTLRRDPLVEKQIKTKTELDEIPNQYLVNAYDTLGKIQDQHLVNAYLQIPDKKFKNLTGGISRMENEEEILKQIKEEELENLLKENSSIIGVLNILIDKIDQEKKDPTKVVLEKDELRVALFFLNERMRGLKKEEEEMASSLESILESQSFSGPEKVEKYKEFNQKVLDILNLEELQFAMAERITGEEKDDLINEAEEKLDRRIEKLIEIGVSEEARKLISERNDLTKEELNQLIFQNLAVSKEEIEKTQDIILKQETAKLINNLFRGGNKEEIIKKMGEYNIDVKDAMEKYEGLRELVEKLEEEGKTPKEVGRAIYQELNKGGFKKFAENLGKGMGIGSEGMGFFILFIFSAIILALMNTLEKAAAKTELPK